MLGVECRPKRDRVIRARIVSCSDPVWLALGNRRAPWKFPQEGVALVLQVLDADFAAVEGVAGKSPQKGEELHPLADAGVGQSIFPIRNQVQYFFLLRGAAR